MAGELFEEKRERKINSSAKKLSKSNTTIPCLSISHGQQSFIEIDGSLNLVLNPTILGETSICPANAI